MKKLRLLTILALCLLGGCYKADVRAHHKILNEGLREAYANLDEANKRERSQLQFGNGVSVRNCGSYLSAANKQNITESIENQLIKSEYLECDALKILADSGEYLANVDVNAIGVSLLSRLDIRSFPNSINQLANEDAFTVEKLFPASSNVNGAAVVVDTVDWTLTLSVVAIVRADAGEKEDWIVQMADESKLGTYRDYKTLIIYNPKDKGSLEAKLYPFREN